MSLGYETDQPTPDDVAASTGWVALEFGANWCGICRAARPHLDAAFDDVTTVRRLKVEDGPGRPLGRAFGIKLWPTLVLLHDGEEVARVVRPRSREAVAEALEPAPSR